MPCLDDVHSPYAEVGCPKPDRVQRGEAPFPQLGGFVAVPEKRLRIRETGTRGGRGRLPRHSLSGLVDPASEPLTRGGSEDHIRSERQPMSHLSKQQVRNSGAYAVKFARMELRGPGGHGIKRHATRSPRLASCLLCRTE